MNRVVRTRDDLRKTECLVVKIGSRAICGPGDPFSMLADALAEQHKQGRTSLLVSSGAVALGFEKLGFDKRPEELDLLQASAAAGQANLMRRFEEAFAKHGIVTAQVLLTHDIFRDRDRYLNTRAAISALLSRKVIPIINENDTVSVDGIRFGDNDQLAAMVAGVVDADLLVLLTNVDGVLDAGGNRIATLPDSLEEAQSLVLPEKSDIGLGGMSSKLDAGFSAARYGISTVIANASEPNQLSKIIAGQDVGSLISAQEAKLSSRKHWISTLKSQGSVRVDIGAAKALLKDQSSLLSVGVTEVDGIFEKNDLLTVLGPDGVELAIGLSRFSSEHIAKLIGTSRCDISKVLGYSADGVVIHRDDLILKT